MKIKIILLLVAGMFYCPALWADIHPINKNTILLIKQSEGFRANPYFCAAGVKTIGYGFTDPEIVSRGHINRLDAENILIGEILKEERYILNNSSARLNKNQISALVSFSFNCGRGSLDKILARINRGDFKSATAAMLRYNKVKKNGIYVVSDGLKTRRQREVDLFNLED